MDTATEVDRNVDRLSHHAERVLDLCSNQARRPFVLELAGTPKAGKTSTMGVLRDFLKDKGFRVSVMRERAADCPIAMKGHFFFNAWTSATMLAQVLAHHDTDAQIVLLDRGFFDALVWLELQDRRHQLTPEEKETFEGFMLLERWRKLTDLTVLLLADPDKAMERENIGRLLPRTGSIMNKEFLATYNNVIDVVQKRHGSLFSILRVDSTRTRSAVGSAMEVLDQVLPEIEKWADPEILALPRDFVAREFGSDDWLHVSKTSSFLSAAESHLIIERRSELERDPARVQLVASATFCHQSRYLLIERSPKDTKSTRFGRHTLWHRCHVEATAAPTILENAKAQLAARIRDDLHLSRLQEPRPIGTLWSSKDDERNHLGLAFAIDIDDPETAESLSTKEFKRGKRAPPLRTTFYTPRELEGLDLEQWSSAAVRASLLDP